MKLKYNHRRSILYKIRILIYVLCLIILFYSGTALLSGWMNYKQASDFVILEGITDSFCQALKNFMFERGRTNVVLSSEDPISNENLDFITKRRTASDYYFEKGFSLMEGSYKKELQLLMFDYESIQTLRKKMDVQMQTDHSQRDPDSRDVWFSTCTVFIDTVGNTLKKINEPHYNSMLGQYTEIIIDTLRFRSITGHESSLFTAAISRGVMLNDEDYATLLSLRGESKQLWYDIKNSVKILDSKELSNAVHTIDLKYYSEFRPKQDQLMILAKNGQLDEGDYMEIAGLSVPALDSMLSLVDSCLSQIHRHNQISMKEGHRYFVIGLLQVFAGILIVIMIPVYLKKQLIRPLDTIISTLEELSSGNTDIDVIYSDRSDEIGKLAQGVELLHKSFIKEMDLSKELRNVIVQLEDLSVKDPLTGLYNRRYVMEQLNLLVERYNTDQSVFSLIICDIDYFKRVNDTYGHVCGDRVLKSIASLIAENCREGDIPCRWGGEEFFIILPNTRKNEAGDLAERMRIKMEEAILQCDDELSVTMTFGVSEYVETLELLGSIQKADMLLLQGKQQGRNRVIVQ